MARIHPLARYRPADLLAQRAALGPRAQIDLELALAPLVPRRPKRFVLLGSLAPASARAPTFVRSRGVLPPPFEDFSVSEREGRPTNRKKS